MKIKVERSGGFAGITFSNEVDIKDPPSEIMTTARKLLSNQKSNRYQSKAVPKGSADHYNYRISIQNGLNRKVVECSEYDIQGELKSLIKFVEKNSDKGK